MYICKQGVIYVKKKSGVLNNFIDQRSYYIEYKKYKECKILLRDERYKI